MLEQIKWEGEQVSKYVTIEMNVVLCQLCSLPNDQTGLCNGYILDWCSGGDEFESWLRHCLQSEVFMVSLSPSSQILG
jgi:hypothetical protein